MSINTAALYDRIILKKNCREPDDCSICLDALVGKTIAYLPCTHQFHNHCLQQAFEKKLYTCPLCRYDLVEALKKTGFIFPIVYDPYTYTADAYARNAYALEYIAYTYYGVGDDEMPELIESDTESNTETNTETEEDHLHRWSGLMVNIMQDTLISSRSRLNAIVPEPIPIEPLASDEQAEAAQQAEPEFTFHEFLILYDYL